MQARKCGLEPLAHRRWTSPVVVQSDVKRAREGAPCVDERRSWAAVRNLLCEQSADAIEYAEPAEERETAEIGLW